MSVERCNLPIGARVPMLLMGTTLGVSWACENLIRVSCRIATRRSLEEYDSQVVYIYALVTDEKEHLC